MIDTLEKLFTEQVKDLYHAEQELLKALPRMSASASSERLVKALDDHGVETRRHVARLEKVFESLGQKPAPRKCKAMVGLLSEMDDVVKECETPEVRDAAIVASAQRIQHYEMAGYGTARTYARTIGNTAAAELLQQTLDEEGRMDHTLTDLATAGVNEQAVTA